MSKFIILINLNWFSNLVLLLSVFYDLDSFCTKFSSYFSYL